MRVPTRLKKLLTKPATMPEISTPVPEVAAEEPVAAAVPDSRPAEEPSADEVASVAAAISAVEDGLAPPPSSFTVDPRDTGVNIVDVTHPDPIESPCPHCNGTGILASDAVQVVVVLGPHALDAAPVNSKLVMTDEGAVLATPDGPVTLAADDPANALPNGARIQKIGPATYRAVQLSPAEDRPALVTATASEAIAGFIAHFHPRGA